MVDRRVGVHDGFELGTPPRPHMGFLRESSGVLIEVIAGIMGFAAAAQRRLERVGAKVEGDPPPADAIFSAVAQVRREGSTKRLSLPCRASAARKSSMQARSVTSSNGVSDRSAGADHCIG